MSRTIRSVTLALGAALLVAPALATAQPGGAPRAPQGPMAPAPRPGAITRILDARRQLDLTPRQVAQLDSLERLQVAEHRAFAERNRPFRDSVQQRVRGGARNPALRDSLRAQARARQEAMRPQREQLRQRDSALTAAADRVLNETQRQRVREMAAARRGYERGLRDGRGPRGGQGAVRGARAPRGGQFGPGARGGVRGPRDGQFGPGAGLRGQQGPMGPGGRGGMPPRRPPAPGVDGR